MGNPNSIPLDIKTALGVDEKEGRANLTIFKMDAGSFLIQNNDKGQEAGDRLLLACSSADDVSEIISNIMGQFKASIKASISGMQNKYEAFDVFVLIQASSDGIEEEAELSTDLPLNIDQLSEAINVLLGRNPVVKGNIFGGGNRGLNFSNAEIVQALAQASGQKSDQILNKPRIVPGKKRFFDDKRRDKTPFGNKLPLDDKNKSKNDANETTRIIVEKKD